MSTRGISNARGSQFLRGATYVKHLGDGVQYASDTNQTIGFTSGVPSTLGSGSYVTIPAEGNYEAHATVYVSGVVCPSIVDGNILPQFGIEFTLTDSPVFQSRRVITAASGVETPYVGLTKLETTCGFYAYGGDTFKVLVRSNGAAGNFVLIGSDSDVGDGLVPYSVPAAVLHLQRWPTTALDSSTFLV